MNKLTIDTQETNAKCSHCGRMYNISRGSVYEENKPMALYIAGMHGCQGDRIIALVIAHRRDISEEANTITLRIIPTINKIEMTIIDPKSSPWYGESYLGIMLTREQATNCPIIDEYYTIADCIIENNDKVNQYLHGKS
jgi:hypothetical protein